MEHAAHIPVRDRLSEQAKARQLSRMRLIASGLVAAMLLLYLAAQYWRARHPWLDAVSAFAEAAMVGGLADWFAVSALFRPPFGLPMAHTAIIPRNQERIANSLGRFIEKNFLLPEMVAEKVAAADPATRLGDWLSHPDNAEHAARLCCEVLPRALDALDDEDMQRLLEKTVMTGLRSIDTAHALANVLAVLTAQNRHQALFDAGVRAAARFLERNRDSLRQSIHEKSPKWVPRMVDERVFQTLIDALEELLGQLDHGDHEWRGEFSAAIQHFIEELRTSEEYRAKGETLKQELLGHPLLADYLGGLWTDLEAAIRRQLTENPDRPARAVAHGLRLLGKSLRDDSALRVKINGWLSRTAAELARTRGHTVGELVAGVVKRWDAQTLAQKIELQVGSDLQYIRINGTLVGGVVGLIIYYSTRLLAG